MGIFSRKKEDLEQKKWDQLNSTLAGSFSSVKSDINQLSQWIAYLYENSKSHEKQLENTNSQLLELHRQLSVTPSAAEIKRLIDEHYAQQDIHRQLYELKLRLNEIASQSNPEKLKEIENRINSIEIVKKPTIKEKIYEKITKNSKDYVKNLILSLIRKYGRISAMQLKDILIEEQGLCSKSSFYRILIEIEQSQEVSFVKEGKEKIYFLPHVNPHLET